jgi:hypothetical protein
LEQLKEFKKDINTGNKELNMDISANQDKLQDELKNNKNTNQDKLQEELKMDIIARQEQRSEISTIKAGQGEFEETITHTLNRHLKDIMVVIQ